MRGKAAKQRQLRKDPKYGSQLVTRFISQIMHDGKRQKAEKIFYAAMEKGAKNVKVDPMDFLNQAVDNVRPSLEVKSRRVGGANYQVPVPVSGERQEALVVRWIVGITRKNSGDSFDKLLERQLMDAFNNAGEAVKKKEEVERMAEANKAFAHFRW
ncbi:MAG: 30S ribosomal protein S7 [Candidatus Dojkabacteria bacterium]|nr:MAG: 30S ribosomal protein S7 [Candidatus Dojkabacteria bacterium]